MNITFYKNSAEASRVDKTNYLSSSTTKSGEVILPLDLLHPQLRVAFSDFPEYNYAYIATYDRYYYITGVNCVCDDVWLLSLSIDALMSWKNTIRSQRGFILRNENTYNNKIPDPLITQLTSSEIWDGTTLKISNTSWSPIQTLSSSELATTHNFVYNFHAIHIDNNPATFGTITLFSNNRVLPTLIPQIITDAYNVDVDFEQFIGEVLYLPCTPPMTMGSHTLRFYLNNLNVILGGDKFDKTYTINNCGTPFLSDFSARTVEVVWRITLPTIPSTTIPNEQEYLKYPPFTSSYIRFNPFGEIKIDISQYIPDGSFDVQCDTDMKTGDSLLYIRQNTALHPGSRKILIASANVATQFPSYSANMDFLSPLKHITSSISGLSSSLLSAATGGYGGAVMAGVGIANNLFNSATNMATEKSSMSTGGSITSALVDIAPQFYMTRNKYNYISPTIHGLPLNETETLSNLSGYTVVGEIHLSGFSSALPEEINMIETALKTGVEL